MFISLKNMPQGNTNKIKSLIKDYTELHLNFDFFLMCPSFIPSPLQVCHWQCWTHYAHKEYRVVTYVGQWYWWTLFWKQNRRSIYQGKVSRFLFYHTPDTPIHAYIQAYTYMAAESWAGWLAIRLAGWLAGWIAEEELTSSWSGSHNDV